MKINFRVEFESTPIRHAAVQCPRCGRWFIATDITKDRIQDEIDLKFASFDCPVCEYVFSAYVPSWESEAQKEVEVEEVSYPDVYKDCLKRKEVWESD